MISGLPTSSGLGRIPEEKVMEENAARSNDISSRKETRPYGRLEKIGVVSNLA
jgi:hypothetical protein